MPVEGDGGTHVVCFWEEEECEEDREEGGDGPEVVEGAPVEAGGHLRDEGHYG